MNCNELGHQIELARAEINRQHPDRALEVLRAIRNEVEDSRDIMLLVDYKLALAEGFSAKHEPAAKSEFEEVLEMLKEIPDGPPLLHARAYEHFADYLSRVEKCRLQALPLLQYAKQILELYGSDEEIAHVEMNIESLTLQCNDDPLVEALAALKNAANQLGSTYVTQRKAWKAYCDELKEITSSLRVARKLGNVSVDYFKHILQKFR